MKILAGLQFGIVFLKQTKLTPVKKFLKKILFKAVCSWSRFEIQGYDWVLEISENIFLDFARGKMSGGKKPKKN